MVGYALDAFCEIMKSKCDKKGFNNMQWVSTFRVRMLSYLNGNDLDPVTSESFIAKQRYIVMPLCDKKHWTLSIADKEKKIFHHFDSKKDLGLVKRGKKLFNNFLKVNATSVFEYSLKDGIGQV